MGEVMFGRLSLGRMNGLLSLIILIRMSGNMSGFHGGNG